MINAEELKELIEKEAIVYGVQNNKIFEIRLKKDFFEDNDTSTLCKFAVIDDCLEINNDFGLNEYAWLIEYLYETKSEAEFVAKYKNIRRTETLDLMTWEEVKSNKRHNLAIFYRNHNEIQFYIKNNIYIVRFGFDGDINFIFKDEKTKENYLEACELCKKLFIGEEV